MFFEKKGVVNFLFLFSIFHLWNPAVPLAKESGYLFEEEETMLMFVGESLDVLSIASRREESAWQAPAVAGVVTRKQIEERGVSTLQEALRTTPGFYMAQKEYGTLPYLRGIPNSVLFLYDTVPLSSDTTKSLHQLDHELSLAPVKRIEIIRGPGSVLWGPDAFAGIVNVVPMTGKDLQGAETGVGYEEPGDQKSFFLNYGHDAGIWDGFLSVSGRRGYEDRTKANLTRFWNDLETPYPPEDRAGVDRPDAFRYLEMAGRLSYEDWLTFSGRISDNRKPYAMTGDKGELAWIEERKLPFGFFKMEAKKSMDRFSALRFTGYYSRFKPEFTNIDRKVDQEESTVYGEIIYDRSFLAGKGLFTGGGALREKRIENAPVWEDYLPELLGPENVDFLPRLTKEDYDSRLWSLFGQYNQKISAFDLWGGLRYDAHDPYRDHLSFNTGAAWSPSSDWIVKLLYGSAYRTPFARQLIDREEPELERIKSLSLQIAWKPSDKTSMSVVGFSSRIDNHIMEDQYAGLSLPNNQNIAGVELEAKFSPSKALEFSSNFTFLDNDGPDEKYYYNDFTFIRPDGTVVEHFTTLTYPYETGADRLFNFICAWKPHERITTILETNYFSSTHLVFPRGEDIMKFPGVWLANASATIKNPFDLGFDLNLAVRNLADRRYEIPGTYYSVEGRPISFEVLLKKKW